AVQWVQQVEGPMPPFGADRLRRRSIGGLALDGGPQPRVINRAPHLSLVLAEPDLAAQLAELAPGGYTAGTFQHLDRVPAEGELLNEGEIGAQGEEPIPPLAADGRLHMADPLAVHQDAPAGGLPAYLVGAVEQRRRLGLTPPCAVRHPAEGG